MDDRLTRLTDDPSAFDLFEAMRLIDAIHADYPLLGEAAGPHDEAVRIGAAPSLDFAPSELTDPSPSDASSTAAGVDTQPRLTSRNFGLLGPNSPMPLSMSEDVLRSALHDGDYAPLHFIELLQHRLISLFYRSHARARATIQADRPSTDRFATYLGALFGRYAGASDRDSFPDDSRLYFTGRNAAATRSAEALESIIKHEFPGEVAVLSFALGWLCLKTPLQTSLGASSPSAQLGVATVVGQRVQDRQSQIRIKIGPLSADEFELYLPSGKHYDPLADLVREFTRGELFCTLQLVVRHEDVPQTTLGSHGQLGHSTWLGNKAHAHDAEDAVFALA